ncbi:MAG: Holliday junction resolvase RuvX [Ruminococcaceae bacterium]|mgnify:CR=1 FL=1|nr:Holliday junction resolvase RuvX [Oscillospiraceae bacterium]
MRIMSVDYGEARTGIAVSDRMEMLANPVKVIFEKNTERTVDSIILTAEELGAELIIVGLPINMDGSEGERAKRSREISDMIAEKTKIPVELWDERGTTKTASVYMNILDRKGAKRKKNIDAAAAAIILESYLQYRKNLNLTD